MTEIQKDAIVIYRDMLKIYVHRMQKGECPNVQSWWLNKVVNGKILSISKINYRVSLLIKCGYVAIDKVNTSKSKGTSYIITDKYPPMDESNFFIN